MVAEYAGLYIVAEGGTSAHCNMNFFNYLNIEVLLRLLHVCLRPVWSVVLRM
jgi:hypothetical protein